MRKRIVFLSCLIVMVSFFASCADNDQFIPRSFMAESDDVRAISISVRDRNISVLPSSDGLIHVEYFESDKESYDIVIQDGCLSVRGVNDKEFSDFIGLKPAKEKRRIVLRIPDVVLDDFLVETTNENIYIMHLGAGSISLSSNGGNILFDSLDAASSITLDVKNGDISGGIIGGYDDFSIQCETKKGECNLPSQKDGGEKRLSVKANNGDVAIDFMK